MGLFPILVSVSVSWSAFYPCFVFVFFFSFLLLFSFLFFGSFFSFLFSSRLPFCVSVSVLVSVTGFVSASVFYVCFLVYRCFIFSSPFLLLLWPGRGSASATRSACFRAICSRAVRNRPFHLRLFIRSSFSFPYEVVKVHGGLSRSFPFHFPRFYLRLFMPPVFRLIYAADKTFFYISDAFLWRRYLLRWVSYPPAIYPRYKTPLYKQATHPLFHFIYHVILDPAIDHRDPDIAVVESMLQGI